MVQTNEIPTLLSSLDIRWYGQVLWFFLTTNREPSKRVIGRWRRNQHLTLGTSVQALSNSRLSRWTALPTSPPAAARTLATTVVSWPPAMTNSPARPPAPWQPPLAFSRSAASCSRCAEALDTSNSLVARTVSTSDRGTVGKAWIKKSRTPSSPEADGAPWRSPTPASRSETRCSRRRLASATSKVLLTRAASTSSLETVGKACNRKSTPELRRSPAPLPLKWWQMLNSWTSDHQPR
mmetsp:Transcript_1281/g.4437  ORF Transcript_1281/g.4437 Transcript_1281/m.4437 type:complete len:237 (+) Transcript_1281:4197-4907(+)